MENYTDTQERINSKMLLGIVVVTSRAPGDNLPALKTTTQKRFKITTKTFRQNAKLHTGTNFEEGQGVFIIKLRPTASKKCKIFT